jgi:hypothetical protein
MTVITLEVDARVKLVNPVLHCVSRIRTAPSF